MLAADTGKALADELGSRATFVSTDVTSEDGILAAIEQSPTSSVSCATR